MITGHVIRSAITLHGNSLARLYGIVIFRSSNSIFSTPIRHNSGKATEGQRGLLLVNHRLQLCLGVNQFRYKNREIIIEQTPDIASLIY